MGHIVSSIRLLLPIWFLTTLLGCGRPAAEQGEKTVEPPQQATVGVSLAGVDGPWQTRIKTQIEAEALKHSDLRLIVMDAQNDVAKQQAQLADLLNHQVDVVIVCPTEAQAVTEPVANLFDAGIGVIALNRALIGDRYTCLISADPSQIGSAAGKWLAGKLHGKGKIVELRGPVDSLWDEQLHAAWRAELLDPGYRFIFEAHVDPPKVNAGNLMSEALERVEEIDVVFAYDDAAAAAAHQITEAAGRENGVLFIGVGGLPGEGATYVSEGILSATFLHSTGGSEAVGTAAKILRGENIPKKIVLPTRAITK